MGTLATFCGGFLAGALSMLAAVIGLASYLATDAHTDPRPGREL